MFAIVRTITYAIPVYRDCVLVYLPARLLAWCGIARPAVLAWPQIAGIVVGTAGALVALSCVWAFAWIGKGTPAPFDPPRKLVVRGPYRFLRNPMYVGAGLALGGAALFFESIQLLAFVAAVSAGHASVRAVLRGADAPAHLRRGVLKRTAGASTAGGRQRPAKNRP